MMEAAEVLTPWGLFEGNNHPLVDVDYVLDGWEDRTGNAMGEPPTEPEPNVGVIVIVCDTAVMDAIDADPDYVIMPETRRAV